MLRQTTMALAILATPTIASANWFFQPKVGYEIKNFEYDYGGGVADSSIPSTIVGFSFLNSGGYYVDFEFSSGTDEVSGFFAEDDYVERFDVVLSGGYSLGNGLVIFGGYNSADTQMENQKNQPNEPNTFQMISTGVFAGISKTFSIDKQNSISLSAAGGLMEGTYESPDLDAGGDSFGYSATGSYSYRSGPMSLSAGLKTQSYSYSDMINDLDGTPVADTTESLVTYFGKLAYRF